MDVFVQVDQFIAANFAREDDHLKNVVTSLADSDMPLGSISANQGKFLYLMATLTNAKRILELGTLGGYSTIWLARALPENGKITSLEINPIHAEIAKENILKAGLGNKIEIINGNAVDILSGMVERQEQKFDLIFFDADKPAYPEYFRLALQLSRRGTLIIADNVVREGEMLNHRTTDEATLGIQRFNQLLADCKEVDAVIITTVGIKKYDGMALAIVK